MKKIIITTLLLSTLNSYCQKDDFFIDTSAVQLKIDSLSTFTISDLGANNPCLQIYNKDTLINDSLCVIRVLLQNYDRVQKQVNQYQEAMQLVKSFEFSDEKNKNKFDSTYKKIYSY